MNYLLMNVEIRVIGAVPLPNNPLTALTLQNALKTVFIIAGIVAVLMVAIGGFHYATSQGNPESTAKAKNTILYAVIGLVLCIMAFAIVNFTMSKVT